MTTELHDHDLEDRLRAVLRDQADTVTGPPPPLTGSLSLATSSSRRRPSQSWRRGIAAAAAAAVLVAGGVVIARSGPDGPNPDRGRVATQPPATIPDPLELLPARVDLQSVPVIFTAEGNAADVARAYLADRLGDGVAEIEARLVSDLVLTTGPDLGVVRTFRWNQDDPGPEPKEHLPIGTVLLRSNAGAWGVVAAVTDGLSLRSVEHDGSTVAGRAQVVRSDAAVGSPTIDLTTLDGQPAPGVPLDPSEAGIALHGNVIEGDGEFAVPVGSTPVVITARSAGGRTLAITEVALTPPPGPKQTDRISLGTPLSLGSDNASGLWPGPADVDQPRSTPKEAISSFYRGLLDAEVTASPAANDGGLAGTPYRVETEAGFVSTAFVERDTTSAGWFIVQVNSAATARTEGCGLQGYPKPGEGAGGQASISCPEVEGATSLQLSYGDRSATWTVIDLAPSRGSEAISLPLKATELWGRVAVYRNGAGDVVAISGG